MKLKTGDKLNQCRIQDFIGDVDLKNCQTAQTPLMNTFYCTFKLQFEKNSKFMKFNFFKYKNILNTFKTV